MDSGGYRPGRLGESPFLRSERLGMSAGETVISVTSYADIGIRRATADEGLKVQVESCSFAEGGRRRARGSGCKAPVAGCRFGGRSVRRGFASNGGKSRNVWCPEATD